jgi:hypothetical protein
LTDSIIVKSKLPISGILDIYNLDGTIWVRFDYWKTDGILVELASNLGSNHVFKTNDSSIATHTADLYYSRNGFLLPQYSKNNLIYFDTLNRKIEHDYFHVNTNKFIPYPNISGFSKSSVGIKFPLIIFNRRSISLEGGTDTKLSRSLKKFYWHEELFTAYDISRGIATHSFGQFSDIYRNKSFLVENDEFYFALDSIDNKLYVSFQASDLIDIYDLNTFKLSNQIGRPGLQINNKLLLNEYKTTWDYSNRAFLNLFADSYAELLVYPTKILRVYRQGIDRDSLKNLEPSPNSKVCASPMLKTNWRKRSSDKKMFIQQYTKNGEFEFEIAVPDFVNSFLGFDKSKSKYLFWNNTFSRSNGYAVIYVFERVNTE